VDGNVHLTSQIYLKNYPEKTKSPSVPFTKRGKPIDPLHNRSRLINAVQKKRFWTKVTLQFHKKHGKMGLEAIDKGLFDVFDGVGGIQPW